MMALGSFLVALGLTLCVVGNPSVGSRTPKTTLLSHERGLGRHTGLGRHSNSTCDKHTGQCCHHACKMTNFPCCHHGRDCCCGGIEAHVNCSSDQNPPFRPLPVPPIPPSPVPPSNSTNSTGCCMFKNFTECDANPGMVCETIPCTPNVTCPNASYGLWCSSHEWHTSCAFNWTYGCSCTMPSL